jgi:hypothetical protein
MMKTGGGEVIRWQPGALRALESRQALQDYVLDPSRRTRRSRTRIEGPRRKLALDTYVHRHALIGPRVFYRGYEFARYDPHGLVIMDGPLQCTDSEFKAVLPRLATVIAACTSWDWELGTITSPQGHPYEIRDAMAHRFILKYKESTLA